MGKSVNKKDKSTTDLELRGRNTNSNLIDQKQQARDKYQQLEFEFFANFRSPHTRENYRRDIRQFVEWLKELPNLHAGVQKTNVGDLVFYRKYLEESNLAPKSICRKFSALSSFFDFLVEKSLMESNPASSLRRPRQEVVRPTEDLSDEQVEELLLVFESAEHGNHGEEKSLLLHKAIIYLLFSTGIRRSELINLKRKDFKKMDEIFTITVKAKGGKFLTKAINPKAAEVLNDYLNWMASEDREVHPEDWIFQPTKNPLDNNICRPLNPKSLNYIVKKYAKLAGLTHRISAHSARATYIGSSLEAGLDLLRVSQDVGHASVNTTIEYNKRRTKLKESPTFELKYFSRDKKKEAS